MSKVDLGEIKSEPNESGEHSLKCPDCSHAFRSTITKDDETGEINQITCPSCRRSNDPKYFVAAAHQDEVNTLAADYVQKELRKSLGRWFK